jgi:hypothetical protein
MADKNQYIDFGIGEAAGNGGDVLVVGNDVAVVYGYENQIYLALFGGNVEQNTPAFPTTNETSDFWANNLLFSLNPDQQYNSYTERVLNTTVLNSSGRIKIENAVNDDLKYLRALGAIITVIVTIPSINTVNINIKTIFPNGQKSITIINFGARQNAGDFALMDFNEDFY